MRVLGVLAAWGVLAVLATMCFALGGSLGYRRGVRDTLTQIRERRTGSAGCRPLPANHLRRRTSGHARPGARARRARWRPQPAGGSVVGLTRAAVPVRSDPRMVTLSVTLVAILLIGVPGVAIGATTAQPGESLYTVRRGLENVRVALARGDVADAEVHVDLATARLTDLQGLVGDDAAADVVTDVSLDLAEHAGAAASKLTAVVDPTHRSGLGVRLEDVTSRQAEVMADLVAFDCAGADDDRCRVLREARDGTLALQEATERDVAVSDQPERDAVVKVEARAIDGATSGTQNNTQGDEADLSGPGIGEPRAAATAGTAAMQNPESPARPKPKPKPSASGRPTQEPSPSPTETPSDTPTPNAADEGSPETAEDTPGGDTGGAGDAAGSADADGE